MTKTYLISYDLITPGKDYKTLHDAIKGLSNTWWHCLESVWIIKTSSDAVAIRDLLSKHIDQNDKLLVVGLSGEGAWIHFTDECSKWLKNNLSS